MHRHLPHERMVARCWRLTESLEPRPLSMNAETNAREDRATPDHPLDAALAARLAFWPSPRTDFGTLEPGWVTAAALFADEAALDDHLAYQGSFDEAADQKSRAAFLMCDYCAMFAMTAVPLLVGAGLVPDLRPSNVALQFYSATVEHDGVTAEVRRAHVRLLSRAFFTEKLSDAAHADAAVLQDRAGLCAGFREGVEDHFTGLIEALNDRTKLARSAMWRLVGDALAATFLEAGRRYGCLEDAKAMALAVLKHPGSPLKNRQLHFLDVAGADDACPGRVVATHTFRARGGCCRYYLLDGRKLCSTCVLHEPAARERLLQNVMRRRLGLPAA